VVEVVAVEVEVEVVAVAEVKKMAARSVIEDADRKVTR